MTNRLATMDLDASESDVGRTSGCVRSVQVDDLTVSTCSLVPRLGLVLRCACSEAADPASRRRMVHGQRIESPLLRPLHRSPASYADGAPTIGRGAPSVLGVATQVTETSRHTTTVRSAAGVRKRHQPARTGPRRHGRVRALNPRVRGSSPWRRTRSRPLTCTHAIDKILCRSHVDVPVLERCSLAETGATSSPLVAMIVGRDDGRLPPGARPVLAPCDLTRAEWNVYLPGRPYRLTCEPLIHCYRQDVQADSTFAAAPGPSRAAPGGSYRGPQSSWRTCVGPICIRVTGSK
jgi:hypothetical protein